MSPVDDLGPKPNSDDKSKIATVRTARTATDASARSRVRLRPLASSAVRVDLIDPLANRLEVGVLRPVRRHDAPQPTQPAEPGLHDHHFAAAATTWLGANTPGRGRHAATRYAPRPLRPAERGERNPWKALGPRSRSHWIGD